VRFYSDFLQDFRGGEGERYRSAEEIVTALDALGVRHQSRDLSYRNGAPLENEDVVEGFLQRCLFDDTVTLADLLRGPRTGPYLEGCRTGEGWRFPQRVKLIVIEP
jgi:hypothetical protein